MNFFIRNIFSFAAFLVMVGMSLWLYGDLPERLPSNFSWEGEVRQTQSKDSMIALLPGIYLGLIFLVNVLIGISPRRFSMPNSKRAMDVIVCSIGVLFCFLHFALLLNEGDFDFFVRYFSYGMALFLIIMGNVFGKTERNFFLGIRLPWTLNSEANWRATHRLSGRLLVVMGAVLMISNSLRPSMTLTLLLTCLPLLIPVIYSYIYYARYEREDQAAEDAGQC